MDFSYAALRRFPDFEAPNLQAWDATDELLVQRALAAGIPGEEIAVIGDAYGAITLALADAGLRGIRVHQDLATGRRALVRNAVEPGLDGFIPCELGSDLFAGARLVLLQLPKSLAELEEIADAVARSAAPDATIIAGGRVKHMTLAQNEVIGRYFEVVQPQRAERKSRLIVASGMRVVSAEPPYPVTAQVEVPGLDHPFTVVAHGGAFAGAKLDIGTRVLLEVLAGEVSAPASTVVDLGCGTGILAATFALTHPDARVIATDRSAAAVASARETMAANGIDAHVTHDDAGSEIPDQSADVVLLNPPFHLGAGVHTGAATRLFDAAARILRPGGELHTVYNSHLGYRSELTRTVGPTEQLHRTSKFTVSRSIRR